MKDFLRRTGWAMLALLFVGTSLGVIIWSAWVDAHQPKTNTSQTNTTKENNVNKLEGKPLANFTPIAKIDSLQKIDEKTGTGAEAKADSTVVAHYTGAVAATGIVFQSSLDTGQPATFPLSGVIKGWAEGVPGMKVGGTRRLLIPASLAYGANPPAGIPVNADLVFDIELVAVQ
jgi:FKBP-type peptidyl-prolyl cis-trans isomerase FkpA